MSKPLGTSGVISPFNLVVPTSIKIRQVHHLAVLHTDTKESQSYSVALQQALPILAPDLKLRSFDVSDIWDAPEIIQQAVAKLKETKYTYFIAAVKSGHLSALWEEAVRQGIARTGKHTWIMPSGDSFFVF